MRLSLLDNRRNFLLYLDEDKVIPKYTVTWKNWDGSDLYIDTKAAEGGIPAYSGPTPTKPATQTVRYEFAGWEPAVVAVTGNTTYTATFTEVPIMLQVQWLNYDSSVIKMEEVQAGTKPVYSGTNPTKSSTAQYRYNFIGWSPSPAVIYEDTVYTAQFQEVPNTVTATFVKDSSDGGGTIKTVMVNYGETPVFGSADPTSTKGVPPEITFEGWEPALGPIIQNTTYTAVFKDNRPYTVQFLARTISEYTDIHEALSEANVTWLNWDGSLLELDRDVPIGTTPTYNGETPTRPAVPGYTYTFAGWDKQIVPLAGHTTYTATYTEVVETHKATFVKASADGGGTLQTINAVPYNTTPNYTAATPTTSKGTAEVFPFIGWDPQLGPMTADTTYTAVFDDLRSYTVKFLARTLTEYQDDYALENDSWETVLSGDTYKNYTVGDTKNIALTDGTTFEVQLVGINADEKSDGSGKAKMSWIGKGLYGDHVMNNTKGNISGGWGECDMRTYLHDEILPLIPAEIRNHIVSVKKTYRTKDPEDTTLTCDDMLWVPSYREVGLTNTSYIESSGVIYSGVFSDNASRVKLNRSGSGQSWWLRSSRDLSTRQFGCVYNGGNEGGNAPHLSRGFTFGFCTD